MLQAPFANGECRSVLRTTSYRFGNLGEATRQRIDEGFAFP